MKLNGILGKGSGKLGSSVFAINSGEQILREYNPRVSNPKTEAQVAQRAKFKLLSQLAAIFSGVYGFKKMGLVSARNQFVSTNMSAVTATVDGANVNLTELLIAKGKKVLGDFVCENNEGGTVSAKVKADDITELSGVIFAFFQVNEDNEMKLVNRQLVTEKDNQGYYVAENVSLLPAYAVYAYGVCFDSNAVRQQYGDVQFDQNSEGAENSIIDKILSIASATTESVAHYEVNME